jgi:hypothetical protein
MLALLLIGVGLFINYVTILWIEKYRYPHWYTHVYAVISCAACVAYLWFIIFESHLVYQGFGA